MLRSVRLGRPPADPAEPAPPRRAASLASAVIRTSFETAVTVAVAVVVIAAISAVLFERLEAGELRLNTALLGWNPLGPLDTAEEVLVTIGRSCLLLGTALATALSVGLGAALLHTLASWWWVRSALWLVGTVGASLPTFFWAIAAQIVVITVTEQTRQGWLPVFGYGLDEHLILPTLALAARPASYAFRLSVTSIEEVRRGDYVRTASAKGLADPTVLRRHVLPNALPGVAAGLVLAARTALSSLAIVEFFFGWGGAGVSFIQAVINANGVVAFALLMVFVVLSAALGAASSALARAREARTA